MIIPRHGSGVGPTVGLTTDTEKRHEDWNHHRRSRRRRARTCEAHALARSEGVRGRRTRRRAVTEIRKSVSGRGPTLAEGFRLSED